MENKKKQFEEMMKKIHQREAQREKSYNKFVKTELKVSIPQYSMIDAIPVSYDFQNEKYSMFTL